jgi:hypothetical protein
MGQYKRNQVEEAIVGVLDPRSKAPTRELRTRLKRLLETDRGLGRTPRSTDAIRANYAFYSTNPQGSGVEVWFSAYEASALLTALRLMNHGWTQSFSVNVMRRIRVDLEKEFNRFLNQDREVLFDQEAIRRKARPGDFALDNTDPVFLVIVPSAGGRALGEFPDCAIHRGSSNALRWASEASQGAGGYTMFELVTTAYVLIDRLARVEPRYRGRNG